MQITQRHSSFNDNSIHSQHQYSLENNVSSNLSNGSKIPQFKMSSTWTIISLALCFSAIFFWLWMNQWTFYLSRASILNETNIKIQFFINVIHNTPIKPLLKDIYTKYKRGRLMYSFWKYLLDQNLTTQEIKDVFADIYPSDDMDQKVFFFDPNKKVSFFNPGIYGTDEIQAALFRNQFPRDCSSRKFIISHKHMSGFGSMIHVLGSVLGIGLDHNRTVIFDPNYTPIYSKNDQCRGKVGLDCYLMPISNCTFTAEEIASNPQKFMRPNDRSPYPQFIIPFIEKTGTPKSLYLFYWRIQSALFITKLNNYTRMNVSLFREKYLVNPKEHYDVSVSIRQGDKYFEMPLVPPQYYTYPLELIHKLLGRKISVFVCSDAQFPITYFSTLNQSKFEFSYFNHRRPEKGYAQGKNVTHSFIFMIQSFADLFETTKGQNMIGTLGSNWNRLMLELRLQQDTTMDLPYFEVGSLPCISPNHCKHLNSRLYIQ